MGLNVPAAGIDERAYEISHHMVQKPVSAHSIDQQIGAFARERRGVDRPHIAGLAAVVGIIRGSRA